MEPHPVSNSPASNKDPHLGSFSPRNKRPGRPRKKRVHWYYTDESSSQESDSFPSSSVEPTTAGPRKLRERKRVKYHDSSDSNSPDLPKSRSVLLESRLQEGLDRADLESTSRGGSSTRGVGLPVKPRALTACLLQDSQSYSLPDQTPIREGVRPGLDLQDPGKFLTESLSAFDPDFQWDSIEANDKITVTPKYGLDAGFSNNNTRIDDGFAFSSAYIPCQLESRTIFAPAQLQRRPQDSSIFAPTYSQHHLQRSSPYFHSGPSREYYRGSQALTLEFGLEAFWPEKSLSNIVGRDRGLVPDPPGQFLHSSTSAGSQVGVLVRDSKSTSLPLSSAVMAPVP